MDSQFQLGLELTNVLNPSTSAISGFGSLALIKAVKSGGSDALTELELASFLGRNRIDPSMELGFRHVVGTSAQTILSRYLDIVIDSGAGPTVQNALQNPELLSMVIQLSLLCFVHEIDTLALAIVDAIERKFKELRADLGKIPHYPSLCGTLRVCKQDTSSFQWHQFYIAVEKRIESNLADDRSRKRRRRNARSQENFRFVSLKRPSIANRILPFPVLQILLLCLHSLQHFPDERILNIECTSGISTAIVWCYYVLGLNVRLLLRGHEINFGEPPANIIIRESISKESCASLLHPNSQHEPLFSLASGEGDPMAGPELRRKARGFGLEIIKQLGVDRKRLKSYCRWVMHRSLDLSQMHVEMNGQDLPRKSDSEHQRCSAKWLSAESYGFTEERIIRAGTFLFDLEPIEEKSVQEDDVCLNPPFKHLLDLWILVVLLLSLARVQAEDLDHCSDLPLSTQVQQQLKNDDPSVQLLAHGNFEMFAFGLIESFDILSRFLQGPLFSGGMNERTVLVSACGWSLYFNSINDVDPAEVFVSTLRIVRGLPSRDGLRKT